jgi:hypothetical protein
MWRMSLWVCTIRSINGDGHGMDEKEAPGMNRIEKSITHDKNGLGSE